MWVFTRIRLIGVGGKPVGQISTDYEQKGVNNFTEYRYIRLVYKTDSELLLTI